MPAEHAKALQPSVLDAFAPYEHFCKAMLDAYAVVDHQGEVVKCNQLFATLVGKKSKQILKSPSLDAHLNLTIMGKPLKVADLLQYQIPTRIDEVRGSSQLSDELNLIMGIYPFLDDQMQILGAFILLRDVTAETNLQDKYKVKATQSITDKLTGLYNRAYFEHYLPATVESLGLQPPEDQKLTIIMVDIDHFKSINDTYGHQAGDDILEKVAKLFKQNFRKTDILCRYGGEEFLAILPATDLAGAYLAAEKFRESIANHSFIFQGALIPVTISLGLAQIHIGQESGEEAIARADAALYFAKKNGRNRACRHLGQERIE